MTAHNWYEQNQRYLAAYLDVLRDYWQQQPAEASQEKLRTARELMADPPALETLTELFGLSSFEQRLLMVTAGIELDSAFARVCADAASGGSWPTYSLALARLPEPHWSAVAPVSPLRRWRLIEIGAGLVVTASPLRIDERILHYLLGLAYIDERIHPYIEMAASESVLSGSQRETASRIHAMLLNARTPSSWRTVQLSGNDAAARYAVAARVCDQLGLTLYRLRTADLPHAAAERETFERLWEREARLQRAALYVPVDFDAVEARRSVLPVIEMLNGVVFVAGRDPVYLPGRTMPRFEIKKPTAVEQERLWQDAVGTYSERLDGRLTRVVAQFDLSQQAIAAAGTELRVAGEQGDPERTLWEICRRQSRPRLDDLAQRIDSAAVWEDLVLPPEQMETLREIAAHTRQRFKVYEQWGFSSKGQRGLGISALFAGASGTGKTLAAEVLAAELRLDLYRIDLSAVVSKYIGETERNLRRVFDAAEEGGAVLLFDEADALFGKRSEVKDSHDRYANIEVSYLLQRMESYRGLAILTSNMKTALDPAFLRRLRFIVEFPFPGVAQREAIWRRVFPSGTPLEGVDVQKLARLNATGGSIRNVALNASFLAADEGSAVTMEHLLRAARSEYRKLEKPLSGTETGGWAS
jgi:hypothetical protein